MLIYHLYLGFLKTELHIGKEMVTHSSILAWRIPWRVEPGRLQSMGSQRVEHDWVTSHSLHFVGKIEYGKWLFQYSVNLCFNNILTAGGNGVVTKSCPALVTPWTIACQAPLSMVFSRQEFWSGLLFPSPGDLPNPGIKPRFPALQADYLLIEL